MSWPWLETPVPQTCEGCGRLVGLPPKILGRWFCECGSLIGFVEALAGRTYYPGSWRDNAGDLPGEIT